VLVAVVYTVCALVWGTTWFAIRRCIGPGGYPTFTSAAIRFALAAAILGALYLAGYGRPGPKDRRQVRALAICGALSAASYGLIYAAERSISGGLACVLFGTFPIVTALVARLAGVERVSRGALVGCGVALAGVGVVFADRVDASPEQGIGVVLVLLGVVASAVYSTIMKRVANEVSPLASTGLFLGTAAVPLGVFGAIADTRPIPWPPPVVPTIALLYLSIVGSVLVFIAYFWLLQRVTLLVVSTLVLVEPIVALAVDAAFERNVVLTPRSYAGMAVTIAGIALSILWRPKG
jgi:drug/metabolite transporter (DMT)-like permease